MDLSQYRVPGPMIVFLAITMIICIILPVLLMFLWRKKSGAGYKSALCGAGTFVVFALILESILHRVILAIMGQDAFMALPFYAIYGGLAAGIFEEMGRYIVMRFLLKKNFDKKESIMFGIGHGGIESIIITGFASISNIVMSVMINAGLGNQLIAGMTPEMQQQTFDQISTLWLSAPPLALVSALERVFAVTVHICASYLVYRAVKDKKFALCLLAILLHALIDGVTVTLSKTAGSILGTEILVGVFSLVFAVFTVRAYRREREIDPLLEENA